MKPRTRHYHYQNQLACPLKPGQGFSSTPAVTVGCRCSALGNRQERVKHGFKLALFCHNFTYETSHPSVVSESHHGSVCIPRRCWELHGVTAVNHKGQEKDKKLIPRASKRRSGKHLFSAVGTPKDGSQGNTSKHELMKCITFPN